jgi:hypothetical protein
MSVRSNFTLGAVRGELGFAYAKASMSGGIAAVKTAFAGAEICIRSSFQALLKLPGDGGNFTKTSPCT